MMQLTQQHAFACGSAVAWTGATPSGGAIHAPERIVVLHGLGSGSREFHYLADHVALRNRWLIFIDAPGHGDSDRPDGWTYTIEDQADLLAEVIRSIAPTPVVLVGHSMGGSTAISIASRYPGLVSNLIVAEPNLDPGSGTLSNHIARQPETRFVARGYHALAYQTEREAARGDLVASRFLITLRQASPVALHRSAVSLRAERSPTFREQLEALAIPRTMITGARTEPLVPPILDPAIRQDSISDAGHVMMIENPAGFADAVARAVAEGDDDTRDG